MFTSGASRLLWYPIRNLPEVVDLREVTPLKGRTPMSRRIFFSLLLLSFVSAIEANAAPATAWEELDIIPMPKHITLTGKRVSMKRVALVVGRSPCRQSLIGADWISRKLVSLAAAKAQVLYGQAGHDGLKIVIGTRADNAFVERAAQQGAVNVGPGNPGQRGYEIRTSADTVYLAGADPIGAVYACVTFAELLSKGTEAVQWRQAEVRDWPDYIHCPLGGSRTGSATTPELLSLVSHARNSVPKPEFRERYLRAVKEHYDRLLRWKVSWLGYPLYFKWTCHAPAEAKALVREGIEYGKERGIGALVYAEMPFAALAKEHPDVKRTCLPAGRYPEFIRCWSLDELRKQTAAALAKNVNDLGITDVGFHDTDTGGYDNPALWNERCEACRRRWGDDYVAATVHKHRIYYDALKRLAPDARMHVTIYPYGIGVLDLDACTRFLSLKYGGGPAVAEKAKQLKAKYEVFWRRMHDGMPPDITFCIRETTPTVVKRFRDIIHDRGVFIWYGFPGKSWNSFFSQAPRWAGTFYAGPRDFMFTIPFGEDVVPLQGLAVREYSWNTQAPGAAGWDGVSGPDQWRLSEPEGDIYRLVLPHIVRNFFGREAAPEITKAVTQNIDPRHIFDTLRSRMDLRLKDSKAMNEHAQMAETGAQALDAAWAKCQASGTRLGMDDYAFRRLVYLREVFHTCMWMAKARAANMEARELAQAQDIPAAEAAINQGLQCVEQAKVDLERLLAERPDDPVLKTPGQNRWADSWRTFMADHGVDMDAAARRLEQTRKELKELGSLGAAPEDVVERLVKRRVARAVNAAGPIEIDGRLTEAAWAGAYPVESFLVYGKGQRIARAHTRARLLYDDDALYVGFTCWVPGGSRPKAEARDAGTVLDDDSAELFLMPRELAGDYVHFMVNAAGSVRQQRCRLDAQAGVRRWRHDNDWTCPGMVAKPSVQEDRWELEMKIPLASLGAKQLAGRWRANLCRNCPLPGDERELSSTQPPTAKDFHDVSGFRSLVACGREVHRPDAIVEVSDLRISTRTMADRIGTVAEFGLAVEANQVLHHAAVSAETYAADGSLQGRRALWKQDRVFYRWQPTDRRDAEFEQQCAAGGIKLTLKADEGSWERWIRFGAWAGTKATGSIYAAGATDAAGFRATPSLRGLAHFPSAIPVSGRKDALRLFDERVGTIEFWLRPDWSALWPPPQDKSECRRLVRCLLHFGVLRRSHPYITNRSCLAITHTDAYGSIYLGVANKRHVKWHCTAQVYRDAAWRAGTWRHIACVWDANAARSDWLRLYVDGKKVAGLGSVQAEDRLGEDKSIRVEADSPYVVQLGSLNTGRQPAGACIDEFRVSRTARYTGDFEPRTPELGVDKDTSALFHFNGSLDGEGVTPEGRAYTVRAAAGVLEYH